MTRSPKIRSLVLAFAAMAVAVSAFAASASAAPLSPTKVLIEAESGGFYGYLKSPNINCKEERTVILFKQLGAKPRPATDEQAGMDTAGANGSRYEWNMGNPGLRTGRYYARAVRTPECRAANSVTLRAQQ
jgi:hypothetical protein